MHRCIQTLRTGLFYVAAVVLAGSYPFTALAQTPPATDTTTTATTPAEPQVTHTFNPDTGAWDSAEWTYDPASHSYVPTPQPVVTQPDPTPVTSNEPAATGGTESAPTNTISSNTPISNSTTVNTDASISNNQTSNSTSGNANVTNNVQAGNAGTGNATADSTIVNTIHSAVQGDTAGIAHFTHDIYGNVTGDITLYPAMQNALVESSVPIRSNTDINSNASITNNIDLTATSGDATVSGNTSAGDATTGNANAVVNLVNLINSIIAANQSFIGTVNIYGNLDGDILVSPDFIPQLLASNKSSTDVSVDADVNLSDSQSIINNIQLAATSGDANVSGNTSAGNATTGNANTNLTVLNLTGREVDAANSLLVFVNVLGTWVGMIVDAPVGATAAALGSGVTKNSIDADLDLNATTNAAITNNINLAAQSGNANVTGNTRAGNATSGNATASANIANLTTSTFNISDWFGILFINVFGSWYGSFGIDTANGTVIPIGGDALPTNPDAPILRVGFQPKKVKAVSPMYGKYKDNGASIPLLSTTDETGSPANPAAATNSAVSRSGSTLPSTSATLASTSSTPSGSAPHPLALATMLALLTGTGSIALFRLLHRRIMYA